MKSPGDPKETDAFLIWSACAVIAAIFALGVTDSFYEIFSNFGFVALAAVFLVWLLAQAILSAFDLSRKKWRRLSALCVIVGGVYFGGIPFWRASATAGEYIHLLAYYPLYRAQINAAGDGKIMSFSWGGTGFVGTAQSDRTLVYDAGGEYGRSVGTAKTEFGKKEIWHLIGNFYLVVDWTY